jgi:hypothetical protein
MTDPATLSPRLARQSRLAVSCTLLLLACAAAERFVLTQPGADAEAYHEWVRHAADAIPIHFDRWLGIEAPVPQSAVTLLKPNAIVSRNYQELSRGRDVSLIVVHCRDSRDILGHYPPICYVNQGYTMSAAEPREMTVDDLKLSVTRYRFAVVRDGVTRSLELDNFMVLPTGEIVPDMGAVDRAARDQALKHFGVAQVQIIYGSRLDDVDRGETFDAFVRQLRPFISAVMRSGRGAEAQ